MTFKKHNFSLLMEFGCQRLSFTSVVLQQSCCSAAIMNVDPYLSPVDPLCVQKIKSSRFAFPEQKGHNEM